MDQDDGPPLRPVGRALLFEVYTQAEEAVVVDAAQHLGLLVVRVLGGRTPVLVEVNGQSVLDGDGEVAEVMGFLPREDHPSWPALVTSDTGSWWSHVIEVRFASAATAETVDSIAQMLARSLGRRAARTGQVRALVLGPDQDIVHESVVGAFWAYTRGA